MPADLKILARHISITANPQNTYPIAGELRSRDFGTHRGPTIFDHYKSNLLSTTAHYYVCQNADDLGERLRAKIGNTTGNTGDNHPKATILEADANTDTIKA
ncbi:MAG TPA: hypothetical protein VHE81_06695 [Lacipirellulaceae bacterium]|nr:hypothetical protein [Lacipirellulaceae bacterium]